MLSLRFILRSCKAWGKLSLMSKLWDLFFRMTAAVDLVSFCNDDTKDTWFLNLTSEFVAAISRTFAT